MLPIEKLSFPPELFDERVPGDGRPRHLPLPLVVHKNKDTFSVIDGAKRLSLLRARNQRTAACCIIETGLTPLQAGLLRIELNTGRPLHFREKLLFVGWLKKNTGPEIFREQAQGLGIPVQECRELELLLECPGRLIEAVVSGALDPAVAPEMSHLKEPDAGALIALFSQQPFSRQMQRELAEWIPEIAFIRRTTVQKLVSENIDSVLADSRLNGPQKAARIRDLVHEIRFPLFSAAGKRFAEQARTINPDPSRVSFQSSPYFEKKRLEIRITADEAETVARLLEKLAKVGADEWRALMDPTVLPQDS